MCGENSKWKSVSLSSVFSHNLLTNIRESLIRVLQISEEFSYFGSKTLPYTPVFADILQIRLSISKYNIKDRKECQTLSRTETTYWRDKESTSPTKLPNYFKNIFTPRRNTRRSGINDSEDKFFIISGFTHTSCESPIVCITETDWQQKLCFYYFDCNKR